MAIDAHPLNASTPFVHKTTPPDAAQSLNVVPVQHAITIMGSKKLVAGVYTIFFLHIITLSPFALTCSFIHSLTHSHLLSFLSFYFFFLLSLSLSLSLLRYAEHIPRNILSYLHSNGVCELHDDNHIVLPLVDTVCPVDRTTSNTSTQWMAMGHTILMQFMALEM